MAREKRIYELWERAPHTITWSALWRRHRFAALLGVAVGCSVLLGEGIQQTWFHLLESVILLDLIALREPARWGGHQILVLTLLHGVAILVVCLHVTWVSSIATGIYSLFTILLLLFPRQKS